MPLDLYDDKSTLVQVMDWCRQATSHYLSQRWPKFMSLYGVPRPQWVNIGIGTDVNKNVAVHLGIIFRYVIRHVWGIANVKYDGYL